MSYEKIKAILTHARESDSPSDLLKILGTNPAFFFRKNKKVLIRRKRKQYADRCVKLGFLDENYKLTELGSKALDNYDEVLSQTIFNLEFNGKNFKETLLSALANIDIPITERIHEKMQELDIQIPISELRNYLNILSKCGILQKNRKYTYTLAKVDAQDFEGILRQEYRTAEKDPTGLIWYEQYKENIMKKYNLSSNQFDELFSEVKKKKPRLISLQRSRTKTWLRLREG
ncbi:MAG: hypothetical protein HWN65_11900 [Candidatus Helarchaeota archaeon]|nr:hypothetical protein [Candidatus Helarchaeota archaeon]